VRRFIESGVGLGVILILGGALFASLGLEREGAGAAWRAKFAQQAECVVGKYSEGCEKYSARIDPGFYEAGGEVGVAPVGGGDAYTSYSAAGSGTAGQASGLAYAGGAPGAAGAPSARYSYLYAGRQLARFDGVNVQFVHGDHLGTGAARTGLGGTVVESSRQLPFGAQLGAVSRETDFTGKKIDGGTGLDYFGARYYGAAIGRFGQTDPILVIPENVYAYVNGNPLINVDPTGRQAQLAPQLVEQAPRLAPELKLIQGTKAVSWLTRLKKYGTPVAAFLSIVFDAKPLNEGEDEWVREQWGTAGPADAPEAELENEQGSQAEAAPAPDKEQEEERQWLYVAHLTDKEGTKELQKAIRTLGMPTPEPGCSFFCTSPDVVDAIDDKSTLERTTGAASAAYVVYLRTKAPPDEIRQTRGALTPKSRRWEENQRDGGVPEYVWWQENLRPPTWEWVGKRQLH